ncbi:MAG: hypothetical protein ACYDDF_08655 [Thermoplasmatota archaeon]
MTPALKRTRCPTCGAHALTSLGRIRLHKRPGDGRICDGTGRSLTYTGRRTSRDDRFLWWLLGAIAVLALLTIALAELPPARAVPSADIPAPLEVIATNVDPVRYTNGFGNPQVQYDVWVNFTRVPQDPGMWNYSACLSSEGGTNPANNICTIAGPYDIGSAPTRVSYRQSFPANDPQRWASFRFSGSEDINYAGPTLTYNVTAVEQPGNLTGLHSCTVAVDLLTAGYHAQCGPLTLAAPQVVNVTVAQPLTASTGQTWIVFQHSSDDPNATTTGDFRYVVDEQFIQYNTQPSHTTNVAGTSPAGSGHAGERWFNVTYSGTSPFWLSLDTVPVDDRRGLHGNGSCQTTVDTGKTSSESRCGIYLTYQPGASLTAPGGGGLSPTPLFPLLNVTAAAASLGAPPEAVSLGLGLGLPLCFAAGAWFFAGAGAAMVVGIIAASAALRLGLIPPWIAILGVFAGALALAAKLTGGAHT